MRRLVVTVIGVMDFGLFYFLDRFVLMSDRVVGGGELFAFGFLAVFFGEKIIKIGHDCQGSVTGINGRDNDGGDATKRKKNLIKK